MLDFAAALRDGGSRGNFNWRDAVLDSLIVAGLNFFTSLSATNMVGVPSPQALYSALVSAGLGFFATLAVKRGLSVSRRR